MNAKITIITPCLNGESYLTPYINGLLSQTYQNVQYIFINDGSDDKTEEIILSYKEKFLSKGWSFTYIKQEERNGQAAAINKGLKILEGDYICCPDSDDILMPTYLEDMSNYLDAHQECNIAFPWSEVVKEKTGEHIEYFKRIVPEHVQDTLLNDMLSYKPVTENFVLWSSYMLRASSFLKVYPDKQIYPALSGQNAQMCVPFIYESKIGYVHKILYKAVARDNSDSRGLSEQELLYKPTLGKMQ